MGKWGLIIVLPLALAACSHSTRASLDDNPTVVAHRGGALLYPEQSMEGFRASADDGFLPEMDIRALADGTLVPAHDADVDRTMSGVSGRVSELDLDEWSEARIRHPSQGDSVPAPTWEEVLNELGGEAVLVPELKVRDHDVVETFIESIVDRDLQDHVVAQTFDRDVSLALVEAGLDTLRLVGDDHPAPEQLASDGVTHAGTPLDTDTEYIAALQEAGITVWAYTVDDVASTLEALERGVDGIFSDDPWASAEALNN